MGKRVQLIRHTTGGADAFVGLEGEITVDTTAKESRVHDGLTAGGIAQARKDLANVAAATTGVAGKMSAADKVELAAATAQIALNVVAIAQEIIDRAADVNAEEARAIAAEGVLQTNINSEASTRGSADTTLQSNIDAEVTSRIADVNAEETARIAADALLIPLTQKAAASGVASLNALAKVIQTALQADILATARTIGGVSFNGSANINLPGVNASGNQNTSGNAASATILQTTRTIGSVAFNGSANINLPGVNAAGNQSTSGNAASATRWATSRNIAASGDVSGTTSSFNGSANATVVLAIGADKVTASHLKSPAAGSTVIKRIVGATTPLGTTQLSYDAIDTYHHIEQTTIPLGTCLVPGIITITADHKAGATNHDSYIRINKNGVAQANWNNATTSYSSESVNVTVAIGDIITMQTHIDATSANNIRNVNIKSATANMAIA